MSTVVVLNASYEPISRTRLSRAVAMIRNGVAVIHKAVAGQVIRSENEQYDCPAVIRLLRFRRVPNIHRPAYYSRKRVLIRDNWTCMYCERPARTIDHVVPQCQGGPSNWLNVVAACFTCNQKKASKSLKASGLNLVRPPWVPLERDLLLLP